MVLMMMMMMMMMMMITLNELGKIKKQAVAQWKRSPIKNAWRELEATVIH